MLGGVAHAANCSTTMLTGNRWSNIRCENRVGNTAVETVAWYSHRGGAITEVVFSSNGSLISRNRLSRQARKPNSSSLASVCPTITGLARTDVWKSKQSNHIPGGDVRKKSTALIVLRGGRRSVPSCINGYNSTGKLVHKLGAYYPTGSLYNGRNYGGWGCGGGETPSQVKRAAPGGLYLKLSKNTCVKIPKPTSCYNSTAC